MDAIFKNHPTLKSYFKTSDGQAFYAEDSAKNHAKTLKDKSVEEVKNKAEEPVAEVAKTEELHNEKTPNAETAEGTEPVANQKQSKKNK